MTICILLFELSMISSSCISLSAWQIYWVRAAKTWQWCPCSDPSFPECTKAKHSPLLMLLREIPPTLRIKMNKKRLITRNALNYRKQNTEKHIWLLSISREFINSILSKWNINSGALKSKLFFFPNLFRHFMYFSHTIFLLETTLH